MWLEGATLQSACIAALCSLHRGEVSWLRSSSSCESCSVSPGSPVVVICELYERVASSVRASGNRCSIKFQATVSASSYVIVLSGCEASGLGSCGLMEGALSSDWGVPLFTSSGHRRSSEALPAMSGVALGASMHHRSSA